MGRCAARDQLKGRVGSRSGALEGVIEDEVNWKSQTNPLPRHPLYAVALALA